MTPFTVKALCHPVIHLVGTGDVDLVALVLVGQTSFVTTLWSPPISGDELYCEAMVERRNGPSWLRDDDDDDEYQRNISTWVATKNFRGHLSTRPSCNGVTIYLTWLTVDRKLRDLGRSFSSCCFCCCCVRDSDKWKETHIDN